MERVHQLVAEGTLDAEDSYFWWPNWHHIASAKVSLETKIAAYHTLKLRGLANINTRAIMDFYEMVRVDRAFVAALDLEAGRIHDYRLLTICIDDDVAALARYFQEMTDNGTSDWYLIAVREINPPRCMRLLLQDQKVRERMADWRMSPLVQQLLEEFVQPTDRFNQELLLFHGQSVKLIGMFVKDEELVAAWLSEVRSWTLIHYEGVTAMFARKLHALATPDQSEMIRSDVLQAIFRGRSSDGSCELAWLFGRLGPLDPNVQEYFLRSNTSLFPAFTFAMIVAICDGYLEFAHEITVTQRRFFTLMSRLPMDLQALVALRLWGHTATVIPSDQFNRALLVII